MYIYLLKNFLLQIPRFFAQKLAINEKNVVMVHSHLMLSQCLNENLGGILGGIQC
jgi:hypothetical protein